MQMHSGVSARLVSCFLEGITHPQRFAEGLRLLAESLGCEQAAVRFWDRRGHWAFLREARRMEQGWQLSAEDASAPHPEWRKLTTTLQPGNWHRFRILHDVRQPGADALEGPPAPYSVMGLRLPALHGAKGLLLLKPGPGSTVKLAEVLSPSGEVVKSLLASLDVTAKLRQLSRHLTCAHLLLDTIRLPLLLLDPSLRLLAANSHAKPLMERAATAAGKRYVSLRGVCASKFSVAVRGACERASYTAGSLLRMNGAPGYQVLVLPMTLRHAGKSERAALVLLHGQAESQASAHTLLQQIYGLTPAEARLATLILEGLSPGDAAASLKLSVTTIRTQLSAILKKTGSRKQAELVRQLAPLMVLDQRQAVH